MTMLAPLDILFMNYAAGRLCPQESLLVAAAMSLNPEARRRVEQFEALGAAMICEETPAALSQDCLDGVMKKIEARAPETVYAEQPKTSELPPAGLNIPGVVFALIAAACETRRKSLDSLARDRKTFLELHMTPREPALKRLHLMRLKPRQETPRHRHIGREITLVLQGSFTDGLGRYRQGEILLIDDARIEHQPRAEDEGCVCLTLTEAPLRFLNPFSRIINTLVRF